MIENKLSQHQKFLYSCMSMMPDSIILNYIQHEK